MGIRKGKSNFQAVVDVMRAKYPFCFLLIAAGLSGACTSNPNVNSVGAPSNNLIENVNKQKVPEAPGEGRPVLHYEPASENSQIASAMNRSGQTYEVRIWTKHPQLLKVESVSIDEKSKALTIVLRSAQVLNITTDRIPNLKLATADQILDLAGVKPVAATPAVKSGPKKAG